MTLNNCTINFDNHPEPVFYSGETVSGTVFLTLNKDKKCEALLMTVFGISKCSWTGFEDSIHHHGYRVNHINQRRGAHNHHARTAVHYRGKETYMEINNDLLVDQYISTGSSDLKEGDHSYRFNFVLPTNIPSSLEGHHGYTRYAIKITLKRSFKFNLTHTTCFTVLSVVNLNLIPNLQLPLNIKKSKNFYFCCFPKGKLHMAVQIPLSGFVPGQPVLVTCTLRSSIRLNMIRFQLKKHTVFTCTIPRTDKKEMCDKYPLGVLTDIPVDKEYSGETTLHMPPLPPSTLSLSRLIDVSYELEAVAVVPGMHSNLSCSIPVVIGTIPIYGRANLQPGPGASSLEPTAPTLDPSDLPPSAPPMENSDLPPPSYEEAMRHESDKKMEDDEEGWNITHPYAPKYPVYDFKPKKEN